MKLPIVNILAEELEPGTEIWGSVRTDIVRALQEYGCLEVTLDEFSLDLHNATLSAAEESLGLPLNIKKLNRSDVSFFGYFGRNSKSLREGTGIIDSSVPEQVHRFTKLMWPDGNEPFSEKVISFTKPVFDLAKKVTKMIFEEFGVEKYYDSHIESLTTLFHMKKYIVPKDGENNMGLIPHRDMSFVTILCQNQVNGLEIKMKNGEWISYNPSTPNSLIVMLGDAFYARSNGRLESPLHRVVLNGKKTRYSVGFFTYNKDIVQTPEELVDEDHPLMFKPFDNIALMNFYATEEGRDADSTVKAFCGV